MLPIGRVRVAFTIANRVNLQPSMRPVMMWRTSGRRGVLYKCWDCSPGNGKGIYRGYTGRSHEYHIWVWNGI